MASGRITQIDGKPIINATKPMTLEISNNDVAKADRKQPLDCVVARACRRDLGAKEVRVHLTRIYIRFGGGSWQRFMTPAHMRADIIAFDRGGTFPTGTYVLNPPPANRPTGKRMGSNPKYNHARKNPNKKKRVRVYHMTEDVRSTPYG